ncbi:aldehyde dehydrogenase family protein [Temperatibacter marinus]|uniref:Aldehyde dehydrogenase family protein n=1 Tax=Temperatibacter marinus TaxID=1456591 RepID=A0AA52EJZ9_9PROT|nr:aldehyde dehydrogenase family protein [Temperatibacter marinus]WND03431.1 aldehyde dehydrogenase family protein [Temperatibacter marinus]
MITKNDLKFYIDGTWVEPFTKKSLDVINPATESPMGQISLGGKADVDRAVAAAKQAFKTYSLTSVEERIHWMEQILKGYKARWSEMAEAISKEMGAPKTLATGSQTGAGYGNFSAALEALKSFEFEKKLGNTQIIHEAIGVCGLITPWNWPINQVTNKVGPAIACGCTMILKPSEIAPFDAMIMAEIIDESDLPKGVFNLVNGDGPTVGEAMSAHPDIDMMSFTGSTRAGSAVATASAPTVKRVAQELGGKSPNIILDDADLPRAIKKSVMTMMQNTGQSCNAPSRLLVPEASLSEVKALALSVVETMTIGSPEDEAVFMGPAVSDLQWRKIQGLIQKGIDEGAELICGGVGKPQGLETGYYVKPTIFVGVTNDMTIAREEIFGPVLAIMTYSDVAEAIAIANDTDYGLSAYIYSSNRERANAVSRQLRAGNIHINGNWGTEATPFGGFKQSGNGREGGVFGFDDYLEIKAAMGYHDA